MIFRRLDKFDGPIFRGRIYEGCYIRDVNCITYLGGIYLVRVEAYKRGSVLTVFYSILMKGRPIVAGRVFRTSAISEVLYCIIEFALSLIPHIFKDSFDFLQRLEKQSENNMLLSGCDTNSLHILEYWI